MLCILTEELRIVKIEKIGSRGVLFTYNETESALGEYCVYLINGQNNVYLCDTHLGPKSMEPIQEYMRDNGLEEKPLVIFLSHADWDHIWGVCAFDQPLVVAHDKCTQRINDRGLLELERYASFMNGNIRLVYPSLSFDSRLSFQADGVEFIFAPGHTEDSAICYDRRDSVAYVGDLVEKPQPTVSFHDLETYIETLESLKALAAKLIISSHSGQVGAGDIDGNIEFLREFQDIALSESSEDVDESDNDMIRKLYTLLMYEDAIQQTAGPDFDYLKFQRVFWESLEMDYRNSKSALLRNVGYTELKLALESYMAGL